MKKLKGAKTKLERAVQKIINRNADGYGLVDWLCDLSAHGCQSGMVSELIYYRDTLPFFCEHKEEIGAMLAELCDDTCCTPAGLFGVKWENSDPLALDTLNQNLLAWFGFEETARRLAERNGIEV